MFPGSREHSWQYSLNPTGTYTRAKNFHTLCILHFQAGNALVVVTIKQLSVTDSSQEDALHATHGLLNNLIPLANRGYVCFTPTTEHS